MIELTDLNERIFVLNCDLIESINNIPETKITLTNGRYYLVLEKKDEIVQKVVDFKRKTTTWMNDDSDSHPEEENKE